LIKAGLVVTVLFIISVLFLSYAGREYSLIKRLEYPINSSIINYYIDDRTNLCYATIGVVSKSTRFHDVWSESFTSVPCTPEVMGLVKNK
jgi:hypothetical protein